MGVLADWQLEEHVKIEPFERGRKRPGVISYGTSSYGYDARVGPLFKLFNPNKLLNSTGSNVIDPKTFNSDCLDTVDLTPVAHRWADNKDGPYPHVCLLCRQTCCEPEAFANPCLPKRDHVLIPPHSFALCETVEYLEVPRDVTCVVVGKSSYARCGLQVMCTPLEPEWKGKVTIEVANTTPCPLKVYVGEGIMQLLFFRSDGVQEALLDAVRRLCGRQMQDHQDEQYEGGRFVQTFLKFVEVELHRALGRSTCRTSYQDKAGIYQNQAGLTLPTVAQAAGEGGPGE